MKRTRILWLALNTIFIIVFMTFFFMLADTAECHTSVWISFGTILFSYIMLLCTPLFVRKGSAQSDYRRPLYVVSSIYFSISFVMGLIVILVNPENYKATMLINVALFGVYAIVLLTNLLANEHIAEQEAKREIELKYVKEASATLKIIMGSVKDYNAIKRIQAAYDLISTSPANSSPSVKSLEESIIQEIADLVDMNPISDLERINSTIDVIIAMATKRNAKLQLENKNR